MKLSDFSIRRPVFVSMIFTGILVIGLYSLKFLPIDLFPDVTLPATSIVTMYPGASPEDVEELVTKVVEDYVSTVPGLKELNSLSLENISVVTARFEWGTDIDEATNDIRSRLDIANRLLPEDIEKPMVFKYDTSMWPIMFFGVKPERSYYKLQEILEDKLADPLRRIPGVAIVSIFGAPEREIHVNVFPDKLASTGISLEQVKMAIKTSNLNIPGGKIEWGSKAYSIRIPLEYKSLKEIEDTVIGYKISRDFKPVPILLKDVAVVKDSFKEKDTVVKVDGERGALVMIQKQAGTNTVEVVNAVKRKLKSIIKKLPSDVEIKISMDASRFIKRSISNLTETILIASLLVILVVFLFLRHFRGSVIISLTIPFSLIAAFWFMFFKGYTINTISLFSLAIAIGMVVDDAIVIYENIFRHGTLGLPPEQAASVGSNEVGTAVIASTLTVVAVFFPIIFIRGITSVMFTQLGLITTVVMLASLFTALTLTPMMSSNLLTEKIFKPAEGFTGRMKESSEKAFIYLENFYRRVLKFALNHRKKVFLGTIIAFILVMFLGKFVGTEFFPEQDQGEIRGFVELPSGTRIERTVKVLDRIAQIIEKKMPEVTTFFMRAGATETGFGAMMGRKEGTNTIMFGATLVPKEKRNLTNKDLSVKLENEVRNIPGLKFVDFSTEDPMQAMAYGSAKPLSIEIYGEYFPPMEEYAEKIKGLIKNRVKGVLSLSISREKGKPELWILPDRWKSAVLGLNLYQVSDTLRTYYQGEAVSQFREKGKEYDIVVKAIKSYRDELMDLANAVFITPQNKWVTLDNLATTSLRKGPVAVERKNQQRIIKIEGDIFGRAFGDVIKDVKKILKHNPPPEGIDYKLGGFAQEQKETFFDLIIAFALAAFLVYMVMASLYESMLDPFIIMFSVPFSVMGVMLGLLITGTPLSVLTFIGLITLIGIVVKNAIVLVDYINLLLPGASTMEEAIVRGSATRLRPVLMTAMTTILGMLPLALLRREGSEMWQPFASAVIFGLGFSTLITLIFVPVVYSMFKRKVKK